MIVNCTLEMSVFPVDIPVYRYSARNISENVKTP